MKRQVVKLTSVKRHVKKHAKRIYVAIKHDSKKLLTPTRALEGLVVLIVVIQLVIIGSNSLNGDRPILGMRVEGRVIGQSGSDFRRQIDTIADEYENKELLVKVADTTSTITLRQLGVMLDREQLYKQVLDMGRTGNLLKRLSDQDTAVMGGQSLRLEATNFNIDLAKTYIASLDQKIDIAPGNAHFAYDQQALVRTDTAGRVVDSEAALAALRQSNPLHSTEVTMPIKQTTAEVTASLLEPLLPQVQSIASKPLKIIAGPNDTVLSPPQLVELAVPKIVQDPGDASKTTAQLTFDEGKLNGIIDELLKRTEIAPQPTIMNGNQTIQQGKNGLQAPDDHSLTHVLTALIQRQTGAAMPDEVSIPLIAMAPPVVQQAITAPRVRTGTGLVRLTFDDGPGAYTEQILNILKQYNVHATFYVIGRNVSSHAGTMQRIRNEGHSIGNHSFTHADLTRLSRAGVAQELASTQAAIQAACGVTPTMFRPPYGAENQVVRDVAASMGMSVDLWSVDTRDWAQPGSNVITQRALTGVGPGAVVLLHVLNQQTVTALPSIIQGIRAHGYTLE